MKVSPALEDNFIPMEAKDFLALQEQKRKRNEHWARMRKAREDWLEITGHTKSITGPEFWLWLATTYGLVPEKNEQGNITEGYTIIDEKLYTIFLLKYSQ